MTVGLLSFTAPAASGGGGSFSDNDWPTPTNRPTGTTTLTWVGPVGGGANNGSPTQQSLLLGGSGGLITTSATNQVISGKNLSQIDIQHDGVTIRNNHISQDGGGGGAAIRILKANITGLTIEDNYIDGNSDTLSGIVTVSGASFTNTAPNAIRRNYLTGFENHITLWSPGTSNIQVTDNYFVLCANGGNAAFDGDMIELYQVLGALVQHNHFDGTGSQKFNSAFNSMINVSNEGAVTATCNNNLFSNCDTLTARILSDGPNFPSRAPANFSWTNNGYYNPGLTNGLPLSAVGLPLGFDRGGSIGSDYTITANSGNYFAATPLATSGTLINGGSGQI